MNNNDILYIWEEHCKERDVFLARPSHRVQLPDGVKSPNIRFCPQKQEEVLFQQPPVDLGPRPVDQ